MVSIMSSCHLYIFCLWMYLIIKLHNNHLNCTSKITVFCFLFSFFQRCIFLRPLLQSKGTTSTVLLPWRSSFYLPLQFWAVFSGHLSLSILHEGIKGLSFVHFNFQWLINKTFSMYLTRIFASLEKRRRGKTFSRNFWNTFMGS